jgi:tRNA pseudouridine55 synthase
MDGFLNINKPSGWTSHDVVARLRSILKIKKVGHTGTLDPAATGVLPICLGKATKLSQLLTETDKHYRAVMRLGVTTDTQDATGRILDRRDGLDLTEGQIRNVLDLFTGEIQQVPPMYSAVKVAGQPLYKAARAGRVVERDARAVRIHRLELIGRDGNDVALDVVCSKGTYIRSLCADIGERLGVGAHLFHLIRLRSGPFRIEDAVTIEEAESLVQEGRIRERVLPAAQVFQDFPSVRVTHHGARRLLHGTPIGILSVGRQPKDFKTGQVVLVYNASGELIALAKVRIGPPEGPDLATDRGQEVFALDKVLASVKDP